MVSETGQARPRIMGVVNVTPDSFSDGGQFLDPQQAVDHGCELLAQGAHILDIGGESTRPGAAPVAPDNEQARVVPVIEGLKPFADEAGALISIDTRHPATMAAAVEAGADIINDVTALTGDPASLTTAASLNRPVMLMHMQGEPQSMQHNPSYTDVVSEVYDYLAARIQACLDAGIGRDHIVVDPGIGFGKTLEHNLSLLKHLARFRGLDVPILLGVSRKSFIAKLDHDVPADNRLGGSIAAALAGVQAGADILRVHDVAVTRQAVTIWQAIEAADDPTADKEAVA